MAFVLDVFFAKNGILEDPDLGVVRLLLFKQTKFKEKCFFLSPVQQDSECTSFLIWR